MIKQQKNYKKLFSISAITICSALFSANAAIAQNVELYGVIDYGYSYRFDRKIYKDNASYAKTNVDEQMDANYFKQIIIDLSHLDFMDSTGIGVLIGRYKKMQQKKSVITSENFDTRYLLLILINVLAMKKS